LLGHAGEADLAGNAALTRAQKGELHAQPADRLPQLPGFYPVGLAIRAVEGNEARQTVMPAVGEQMEQRKGLVLVGSSLQGRFEVAEAGIG
jgi:hypothetical protein